MISPRSSKSYLLILMSSTICAEDFPQKISPMNHGVCKRSASFTDSRSDLNEKLNVFIDCSLASLN